MADCPKMGRSTLQSPESNPWVQVGMSSPAAHGWAMPSPHGLPSLLKILRKQIESGPRVAHRVAGTRLFLHIAHQVAGLARTYPSSWGPAKEQPTTCLSSMSDLHELGIVTGKSRSLASYLTAYIYSPFCSALGVKWTWTEIFWIRKEDRFQMHGLFLRQAMPRHWGNVSRSPALQEPKADGGESQAREEPGAFQTPPV